MVFFVASKDAVTASKKNTVKLSALGVIYLFHYVLAIKRLGARGYCLGIAILPDMVKTIPAIILTADSPISTVGV